jgi:uncharacterized protein (TIGR02266 family)
MDDRQGNDEQRGSTSQSDAPARRTEDRVEIATDVTLKSADNLTAAGTDLSVGGIYVVTSRDLPVGSLVDLEFEVEGIDRTFELLGEVKWRQLQPLGDETRCGLGIEFVDLDDEQREALQEFVEQREPIDPADRAGTRETDIQ